MRQRDWFFAGAPNQPVTQPLGLSYAEVLERTFGGSNHIQNFCVAIAIGISRSHLGKGDCNSSSRRPSATNNSDTFSVISGSNSCTSGMCFLSPSIFQIFAEVSVLSAPSKRSLLLSDLPEQKTIIPIEV